MPWEPQGPVDDMTLAALPFPTAQRLLSGVPLRGTARRAVCEWHGPGARGDERLGSYAMVREGSGLEELVGERIRVRFRRLSVFAYVHRATDDLDDDMSLARMLYARLAPLSETNLAVLVEVVS